MNLFEFFFHMTHPEKRRGWTETTAVFTGQKQIAKHKRYSTDVARTLMCYNTESIQEYEIKYTAGLEERTGWYMFFPDPDYTPEEIKGTEIRIRYQDKKPWIFEEVPKEEDDD